MQRHTATQPTPPASTPTRRAFQRGLAQGSLRANHTVYLEIQQAVRSWQSDGNAFALAHTLAGIQKRLSTQMRRDETALFDISEVDTAELDAALTRPALSALPR